VTGRGVAEESTEKDVRKGFVCRRVPHITVKSIAQNQDIREGMAREEVEAAIARHADQEVLVDQPYEAPKTVRVFGALTSRGRRPDRALSGAVRR
jgi:adenine-specific DNA-methyltransferase